MHKTPPLIALALAFAALQACGSQGTTPDGSGGQAGSSGGAGGIVTGGGPGTGGSVAAGRAGTAGSGGSTGGTSSGGGAGAGGGAAVGSGGTSSGQGGNGASGGTGGGAAGGGGGSGAASGSSGAGGSSGGAQPMGGMGGSGPAGAGGSSAGMGGSAGAPVAAECQGPSDYPNLFVTISGHTQEESDAKVQAAWNQLYNPSNPNTVYYDGPGSDESYVKDTGNNDVRTEGMSYGMMTALQLDKQNEFDRLWAWVKNHMAQGTTSEIAWHCSTNGNKLSNGGAPDGEEYMATALIFADRRWGSTSGRFDYAKEAQWVLDVIRTKYFNTMYHIVKFVSTSNNTDGSYVLPAFYQVWACFDTANADFWNEAVKAAREFFPKAADSNGVIPDQSSFTGQALGGAGSDAKRCVMNIMMDANFFGADPWQTETYAPAFAAWMKNHSDNSAAQFSCNALLGFGVPASTGKPFVDRLWSAQIPTGTYRYYDGTLYMLGLLHVSGTFKLWL